MASSSGTADGDVAYQAEALQAVSKTFALTIPQLPDGLRDVVTNAYLLCRLADTIEDEPDLSLAEKERFLERLVEVVSGRKDPVRFGRDLGAALSSSTPESERDLVANAGRVVRITRSLNTRQQAAIERCLRIMACGMLEFQRDSDEVGLNDLAHLDRYCYHVAGVVGEMLSDLFCDYSPESDEQREELFALAVSYGQGLQMTNILKDVWGDWRQGACWLPRDVFAGAGFDLRSLSDGGADPGFVDGLHQLVSIAHRHLAGGLQFILLIPARQSGIRRYLLWTLALAAVTLRGLFRSRSFGRGGAVLPSGGRIRAAILLVSVLARSDFALKVLFRTAMRGVPLDPEKEGLAD